MGIAYNAAIVRDNLVLCLDAANPKNYNLTEVEVLVVAGGGAGGNHHGGGGGGGGLLYSNSQSITPGSAITVTVGAGGAATSYGGGNGGNGGNSVFGALTAIGGGGGGSYANNGSGGGSGGGSNNWSTSTTGGTGTSGQGFAGGSNNGTTNFGGGGGGAGGTAKGLSNNSGGDGLAYNISGTQTYYSGGGGSGVYPGYANQTSYGFGGLGGGGNGGNGPHGSGTAPTAGGTNTGGGGGGVADLNQNSAGGGSGIVIVRYQGPQKAIGGTITSNSGYTIHTFTTSSTFTPLVATNNSAILGLSDFSGGGNFGTSVNGPTYSSANGGSLVFDGVDDYVNLTDKNEFTFTNARFSLEVFFRYVNKTDTDNSIFGKRDYGATQREYNLYIFEPSSTPTLRFIISSNLTADWTIVETPAIQKNVWYHAIATSDSGVGRIYLNGSLSATNSFMNSSTTNGTSPLSVGCAFNSGSPLQYFNGSIPLVRLYNRALTAAEIQQNYNALKSRFGLP